METAFTVPFQQHDHISSQKHYLNFYASILSINFGKDIDFDWRPYFTTQTVPSLVGLTDH
jgi:hypothetical protein